MANKRTVLVSGSCGQIGSGVARWFARARFLEAGIDSNHRSILFQLCPALLARAGEIVAGLYMLLADLGNGVFRLAEDGRRGNAMTPADMEKIRSANLLAMPILNTMGPTSRRPISASLHGKDTLGRGPR